MTHFDADDVLADAMAAFPKFGVTITASGETRTFSNVPAPDALTAAVSMLTGQLSAHAHASMPPPDEGIHLHVTRSDG